MNSLKTVLLAGLLLLAFPYIAIARPLLVLDSGHTPQKGGALSLTGRYEVIYNDRFVSELKKALQQSGWQVVLTRQPNQEISLAERAELANQKQASLFLSIHHDSAQLIHLQTTVHNGKTVYTSKKPIRGYSLFVSTENPKFEQSKQVAISIGQALRQLGRPPSLYHAEPIEGENRTLLDKTNGVYRYDQLVVLRKTQMPAVLLEVGVLVDRQDEAYVDKKENRQAMIQSIVQSLKPYQF